MTTPPRDPFERLKSAGERLPQNQRGAILALGEAAVPRLIDLLQAEPQSGEDRAEGSWAASHAVDLLIDLKAEAAIEPMLALLAATDLDEDVHHRIAFRLPELGAPVLEPALALLPEDAESDLYSSLCDILSKLSVVDERIYLALERLFQHDQVLGGAFLADYGDDRAVALLETAIRNYRPEDGADKPIHGEILDLADSYEALAGELSDELQEKADAAYATWEAQQEPEVVAAPAASTKVGRNEPCPCGSGKKHKRCCLGKEPTPPPT